jgi:hypothetical protein
VVEAGARGRRPPQRGAGFRGVSDSAESAECTILQNAGFCRAQAGLLEDSVVRAGFCRMQDSAECRILQGDLLVRTTTQVPKEFYITQGLAFWGRPRASAHQMLGQSSRGRAMRRVPSLSLATLRVRWRPSWPEGLGG